MKVRTFTPPPLIADYVSSIIVLENNSMFYEAILPLIANGFPSIAFQLTDPARILIGEKKSDQLVLYGQNTSPIQLHTAGEVTVIACFLYPYTLQPLFGYPAKELANRSINLSHTAAAKEMNLQEQLLNAVSLEARLQLMNQYVLQLARRKQPDINERVAFATRLIQQGQRSGSHPPVKTTTR